MMTDLCRLAYRYGSDKCPIMLHHYTPVYYNLFKDKRKTVKKVLEIGVGGPQDMSHCANYTRGASLYMWRDFFPKAQIYALDIVPELIFKDERIVTFLGDQTKTTDLKKLIKKIGKDIDLVIDDGSHKAEDQIFTCLTLMPLLNKEVIYAIEDIVDLNSIMQKLSKYDCQYERFRPKGGFSDRLVIVRNK